MYAPPGCFDPPRISDRFPVYNKRLIRDNHTKHRKNRRAIMGHITKQGQGYRVISHKMVELTSPGGNKV